MAHIVWFKLQSYMKYSFGWNATNISKHVASMVIFGGFAVGVYYASRTATDYLLDSVHIGQFLFHRLLSMLLFVFFLSINVGNIIVSYATFYRSTETAFYLTRPVTHTNLFIIKFLDNFFYSSTAFFLLALAVLLGYGSHYHSPWTFYLGTMVFLLLPYMMIAACLAVIILLVIMRLSTVIGTKKMIIVISLCYLESLFLYFSVTNPLKLVNQIWQHYPNLDQNFSYLDPAIAKYLPNYWIADSLYRIILGQTSSAVWYACLLLLVTIAIFGAMVVVGNKLFYSSWLASLELNAGVRRKLQFQNIFSLTKKSRLGTQTSVLLKKDFAQFIREPSQWIHLLIIAVLVGTFMVSVAHINLQQKVPFLQTISYLVVLLFNAFLIASIALRFIFPAMNLESLNFWKIVSSPVRLKKVFWLKYAVGFIITLIVSEFLVIFSHRSVSAYPVLQNTGFIIMFAVALFFTSLNLGVGTYFADYKEKNPIRIASSQSATLTFMICILYLVIVVAVTFIPYKQYFISVHGDNQLTGNLLIWPATIVLGISIILGTLTVILGLKSLSKDYSGS
jgi:ABC-2 type transport system permease protein